MGIDELCDAALPLNRKERYWTGTVFPMLVCADGFKHFGRFTRLVGLGSLDVDATPGNATIEFFTEYGFIESLIGDAKTRFPEAPPARDTPDVLIYLSAPRPILIGVEAKLYDRPSTADLKHQLQRQRKLLAYIGGRLGVADDDTKHVALLPDGLNKDAKTDPKRTVTWEQLLKTYADVADPYFVEMLRIALERYDELASPKDYAFGANAEAHFTGGQILAAHLAGTLQHHWMGRAKGLDGPALADDIASGSWKRRKYETRSSALPSNPNWFAVAEFVALVQQAESGTVA